MSNIAVLKESLTKIEGRFIELTDRKTFDKESSFAMQHFSRNPYLDKSTIQSKIQAVLNVAQTGLTLNPVLKLAYLIPRYEGGAIKCYLEPSYQGLVKLITDTGSARNVVAYAVCKGDIFEVSMGTDLSIEHKPKFESKEITHVYSIASLHDGSKQIEVMTAEQVDEIRANSESYKSFKAGKSKSCIWDDHYSEMARKTVVKRLVKYLPKTDMWDKLGTAIELDNTDYKASDSQIDYIDGLILTANISAEEMDDLTRECAYMSSDRAGDVIEYLQENQTNAITSGRNYAQGEISDKIQTEITE